MPHASFCFPQHLAQGFGLKYPSTFINLSAFEWKHITAQLKQLSVPSLWTGEGLQGIKTKGWHGRLTSTLALFSLDFAPVGWYPDIFFLSTFLRGESQ